MRADCGHVWFMKFCATFLSLCDDEEEKEMEEEEEEGGRATHGGNMEVNEWDGAINSHRRSITASYLGSILTRRAVRRFSFYFTSYRSRATLRSKWKRLIFFVSLLFVERIRDPARFGIEFVFIRSEYAVLLGIGIIKGSNARIFFGNFSISFYILSFRCVNSIDNCWKRINLFLDMVSIGTRNVCF